MEKTQKRPRGRPRKNPVAETQAPLSPLATEAKTSKYLTNPIADKLEAFQAFSRMFKKMEIGYKFAEQRINNYTEEDLLRFMESPITFQSQLVSINNFMYLTSVVFRELIDFYVKPTLYRWTIDTHAINNNFDKVKIDRIRKDFLGFIGKINQLNLNRELHRLLTIMFIEDVVFGYWIEEGDTSTIYYLPSSWCTIKTKAVGNWNFVIKTKSVPQKDLEVMPKELQSLIKKYRDKSGDAALAPVPFEKSVCYKYNDHLSYVYPPFTSVIPLILDLMKAKQISLAKDEMEAINLIQMLIPIDDKDDDHLRLTNTIVEQFAVGAQDLVPENNAIIPTPMPLTVLDTDKGMSSEKNTIKNAITAFNEETGMPSFGSANNAAEMKRALENASAKVFVILNQISDAINLKMRIDGFNYNSYEFEYKILHMNVFNETDTQDRLLKQAQSGAISKFEIEATRGKSPVAVVGQHYLENVVFRAMFDDLTVPPTSHTQSGLDDEVGRSAKDVTELSPAGENTQNTGANDPANRDI